MATAAVRTTGRGGNRSITAAAALGITAALLLSGCGSSDKPSAKSSTPSVAPSSTDPNAAAKTQVLAAYHGMWDAKLKLYATGSFNGVNLEQFAHDKALAEIKQTAFYYQDHNSVMRGKPILLPTVTAISTSAQPNTATITDCVDTANYTQVDKTTGKSVQVQDGNRRHVTTYHAQTLGGKWLIMDFTIERDRSC